MKYCIIIWTLENIIFAEIVVIYDFCIDLKPISNRTTIASFATVKHFTAMNLLCEMLQYFHSYNLKFERIMRRSVKKFGNVP